jgi:hypothetical protein
MKIEQAYSLDSNETVDAELAYDYYWAGIIKNKKNFECPANNCSVPITCANLDKIRQDMKVDPYFKTVGEHYPDCELERETLTKNSGSGVVEGAGSHRAKKSDNLPDIFGFSRPTSHFDKKQKTPSEIGVVSSEEGKRKRKAESNSSGLQPSTHYSLRAFVSKFLRYKSLGVLGQRHINIKGYDVSYQEMFVSVSGKNLNSISKYPRMYFGKAFIDKRKESDYSANFEGTLSFDEESLRPSAYISKSLINDAFTKKLSQEKFEVLSNKNYPICWVFVYGVPKVKNVNGKNYININISNLDYFDLREKI